ncbi:MAG: sensor histidine kinase [Oscillospiraceae bacterium]|nr:sensor histidine kinase [Oscillospiraceae bacterium]
MEEKLLNMSMELCRDPMIAVRDGILTGFNRAASAALPKLLPGTPAAGQLPEALLDCPPGDGVSLTPLGTRDYSVRCTASGPLRLYAATPLEEEGERGFLSEGVMHRLLSGIGNLNLAVEQMDLAANALVREQNRAILNRSRLILTRQLGDLRTALALMEGNLPMQVQELELVGFCRALCEAVTACTADLGTVLRFETEETALKARLDGALLERILLNLLSNSFAATPAGGWVLLRLERRDSSVLLTVADNGRGIPPEILDRVFRRYTVRATPEDLSPAIGGGLGLYLVSGLTRLMGGTPLIESPKGEGTVVRLSLPRDGVNTEVHCGVERAEPLDTAVRRALAELLPLERFAAYEMD